MKIEFETVTEWRKSEEEAKHKEIRTELAKETLQFMVNKLVELEDGVSQRALEDIYHLMSEYIKGIKFTSNPKETNVSINTDLLFEIEKAIAKVFNEQKEKEN